MVLHTNNRCRFLKDGFQPVNSFQYTTAAIHERDKYSEHKALICIECIFMNKCLPLPLIVFAVQSVKNGPTFSWLLLLHLLLHLLDVSSAVITHRTIALKETKMFSESLPTYSRLDSSTSLH